MDATITGLTGEAGFHAALDADPENWQIRQVFADWLDEHGDPRGPGYRCLGALGLYPADDRVEKPLHPFDWLPVGGLPWGWRYHSWLGIPHACLPAGWVTFRLKGQEFPRFRGWSYLHATRRKAEDAAAFLFAKLPAECQAELLAKEHE